MSTDVSEVSFEYDLDPEPAPTREPIYVDVVAKTDEVRPIIPAQWRGVDNAKATLAYHAARTAHRVGYHAARSPWYTLQAIFWAVIGVFRIANQQRAWWWHADQKGNEDGNRRHLKQGAANHGDYFQWKDAHNQMKATRLFRGIILASEAVAITVVLLLLRYAAPLWLAVAVVAVAIPVIAHFGRPATMPIVRPAVVTPRFRKLTADIVARAYYAAGLGHPDKPDQQIGFPKPMARNARNTGSEVIVDLPYGKSWADMVKPGTKLALASGIDVTEYQMFFTRDKTSDRRHKLLIADVNPLAIPVGHSDLLDCKPRSIWAPMRLGKDERDDLVKLALIWNSILIGAQPRKGKTFTARLVGLYCALDPWVELIIADGKKSTDWDKFRLVARRFIVGAHPNPRDKDPIGHLLATLDEILAHIDRVNDVLAQLPVDLCPEGVLTEELTRDPRFPDLRFWLVLMEEFQVYFETEDQEVNKQIAAKLSRIQATGPSAGVIVVSSSQKPSGVGAGDVGRLFNRYRDNHQVRFALKCGNRDVSIAVLGGDSYQEGYDASALPVGLEYRGVGYLYGASDATPTVRTFFADHVDAEKILTAARAHRERLGTLSGEAAGEDVAREARDVLADALNVFYAGKATISWPALAARLQDAYPEAYADITPDAISAMIRSFGVPGKSVKDKDNFEKGVGQGCDKSAIEAAIKRRSIGAR